MTCTVKTDALARHRLYIDNNVICSDEFKDALDKVLTCECHGKETNQNNWEICEASEHKNYYYNFIAKNITKHISIKNSSKNNKIDL